MSVFAKDKKVINQKPKLKLLGQPAYKLKRKFKMLSFLLLYLFMLITIVTVSGYLIYDNKYKFANATFNPDGDLNNWDDYYNKHKTDHKLIDIASMGKYFNENNNVNVTIGDMSQKTTKLNFYNFTKEIDNKLISASLEAQATSDDSDAILPNQFIQNVIYNPDVAFTIKDNTGKEVPASSFIYNMPTKNGDSISYQILMNISQGVKDFGIDVNQNRQIPINIKITNNVMFDLKNLNMHFSDLSISTDNSVNVSVNQILKENPTIENNIKKQFTTKLQTYITGKVSEDSYNIVFDKSDIPLNWNDDQLVTFTISATSKAKANGFTGNLEKQSVTVKNVQIALSKQTDLSNAISAKYLKTAQLVVDVTNNDNDDTNLSATQIANINKQISANIQTICQTYFQTKYPGLNVQPTDYSITSDLKPGTDIFNQKQGLDISLTISPTVQTSKFNKNSFLTGVKIHITGKNKNLRTQSWALPNDFANKFEGIWLANHKDKNILQDGEHLYEQVGKSNNQADSLFQELVTNGTKSNLSLLDKIKTNSYNVDPNSFTGNFVFKSILDASPWNLKPVKDSPLMIDPNNNQQLLLNVAKIVNSKKGINNFYDLINKTKTIYLYSNVIANGDARSFKNLSIKFYDQDASDPQHLIYTIDFSPYFDGINISNKANFYFTTFAAQITYQQWN